MSIFRNQVAVITAQGRNTFTERQASNLEAVAQVDFSKAIAPLGADEIIERLGKADYLKLDSAFGQAIDGSWLERLPRLKGIAVFATGVDYIDTAYLRERGILLSHLPDYSTVSVAEHTLGLLLTLSRRIHLSQDRVRGRVPAGTSVLGWELCGRTIGIVGLGRIGSRVAGLARAFGMRVLGHDPNCRVEGVPNVSLEELLASSDVVSLHFPARWQGKPSLEANNSRE